MFSVIDYDNDNEYVTNELNFKHHSKFVLDDLVERTSTNYQGNNPIELYCSCRAPFKDKGIMYSVLKNSAGNYYVRTKTNNGGIDHDPNCIKHPNNTTYKSSNPAFADNDENKCSIKTHVNFNKAASKKDMDYTDRPDRKCTYSNDEEKQGCIRSVHELFSLMNEVLWQKALLNGHKEIFNNNPKPVLCRNPYWNYKDFAKHLMEFDIKLGNLEGPLSHYSIEDDGISFVYGKVIKIYEDNLAKSNDNFNIAVKLELPNGNSEMINIPCWFYITLKNKFSGHYENRTLDWKSSEYNLVLAGSCGKNPKSKYNSLFKGTFLMTSPKYGVHSESVHEARFYDMAMNVLNETFDNEKLYKRAAFYKPCEFLPAGIYTGRGLPDGIVVSRKTNRKCVIEVYGSHDPVYLARRKEKEDWLAQHPEYDYLYWDILDPVHGFDDFTQRFREMVQSY